MFLNRNARQRHISHMQADADALNGIQVRKPCRQSWAGMKGDDQKRFCAGCRKHVYNLSGMTREEAAQLIRETEGQVCVRFYRRADGTVATRDCNLEKETKVLSGVMLAALAGGVFQFLPRIAAAFDGGSEMAGELAPVAVDGGSTVTLGSLSTSQPVMGKVAVPASERISSHRDVAEYQMGDLAAVPEKGKTAATQSRE